jgi:hypothetical protein
LQRPSFFGVFLDPGFKTYMTQHQPPPRRQTSTFDWAAITFRKIDFKSSGRSIDT